MESNANKRDVKTDARDDLKSLPMPELQAKLRFVAGWPQSSRGAETADPIWA